MRTTMHRTNLVQHHLNRPHIIPPEHSLSPIMRTAESVFAECDLEMLEHELVRNHRAGKVERVIDGVRLIAYSKSAQAVLNGQQRKMMLALIAELEGG